MASGPFSGMRFAPTSFCGAPIPRLLGIYELELHWVLTRSKDSGFGCAIDIGAAEGYYAIGLVASGLAARVVAFESNPDARQVLRSTARSNGVSDRIDVRGSCSELDLYELSSQDIGLVIVDIEGAEVELLSVRSIERLDRAVVVVECHESIVPGCFQLLAERLVESHSVERCDQQPRNVIFGLGYLMRRYIVNEFRHPEDCWLIAIPKRSKL